MPPPEGTDMTGLSRARFYELFRDETRIDIDPARDLLTERLSINRALRFINRLWKETGLELDVNVFYIHRTLDELATAVLEDSIAAVPKIVPLRDGTGTTPLLVFAGGVGCFLEIQNLVAKIETSAPIFGIALTPFNRSCAQAASVQDEVESALRALEEAGVKGPYSLLGYSIGGILALELARALQARGDTVAFLGVLDTPQSEHQWPFLPWLLFMLKRWRRRQQQPKTVKSGANERRHMTDGAPGRASGFIAHLQRRLRPLFFRYMSPRSENYPVLAPQWVGNYPPRYDAAARQLLRMKGLYKARRYEGELVFYRSLGGSPIDCDPKCLWSRLLPAAEWVDMPGTHQSMLVGRNVRTLAKDVGARLSQEDVKPQNGK